MKYVFTVQTSDDGLMQSVTRNIKALFNYIGTLGVTPQTLFFNKKDIPYNYNNLVKVIRDSQSRNHFNVATIYCKYNVSLDISDLSVLSK